MYLSAMHKCRILCGSSLVMTCFICKVFFALFTRYSGCCHMLMSHSGCQNYLYSLNFLLLLARCAADEPTRNAWRILNHTRRAEAVMAYVAASQHWITAPTIAFRRTLVYSWWCYSLLLTLQSLLLLFSSFNITFLLIPFHFNVIPRKFILPEKLLTFEMKSCGGILL